LPVPYFHVTFTLPQQIGRLALQNPRQIYTLLFQAASETLLTIAADLRHLGASIGFLAAAYLGSEPASSSALALHRSWRRPLPRRLPLDRLPEGFLLPSL
jgi:hypothetical protein